MSLQDVNDVLDIVGRAWEVIDNDVVVNESTVVQCVANRVPLGEIDDSMAQAKASAMRVALWNERGKLAADVKLAVVRTFGIRYRGRGAYITDAQIVREQPTSKPFVNLTMTVEVRAAHPSFGSEGVAYLEFLVTLVATRTLKPWAPTLRNSGMVKLYGDGRAELETSDHAAAGGAGRGLPDGDRPGVAVPSQPQVLGDERPAVFDGGGVDEPVGRVARERSGQGDRGGGDRRRRPDRAHPFGEPFQPRPDRDGHDDALVVGQPAELEPRDRRHGQLVGADEHPGRTAAQPTRFGRPPVNDVGVEEHGRHGRFQVAPVVKRSSSSAAVIATPSRRPFKA